MYHRDAALECALSAFQSGVTRFWRLLRKTTSARRARPKSLITQPAIGVRQSSEPEVPETSWVQTILR